MEAKVRETVNRLNELQVVLGQELRLSHASVWAVIDSDSIVWTDYIEKLRNVRLNDLKVLYDGKLPPSSNPLWSALFMSDKAWSSFIENLKKAKASPVMVDGLPRCGGFLSAMRKKQWACCEGRLNDLKALYDGKVPPSSDQLWSAASMESDDAWSDYIENLKKAKASPVMADGLPRCGGFHSAMRKQIWARCEGRLNELQALWGANKLDLSRNSLWSAASMESDDAWASFVEKLRTVRLNDLKALYDGKVPPSNYSLWSALFMESDDAWSDYIKNLKTAKAWPVMADGLPRCGGFHSAMRREKWARCEGRLSELKALFVKLDLSRDALWSAASKESDEAWEQCFLRRCKIVRAFLDGDTPRLSHNSFWKALRSKDWRQFVRSLEGMNPFSDKYSPLWTIVGKTEDGWNSYYNKHMEAPGQKLLSVAMSRVLNQQTAELSVGDAPSPSKVQTTGRFQEGSLGPGFKGTGEYLETNGQVGQEKSKWSAQEKTDLRRAAVKSIRANGGKINWSEVVEDFPSREPGAVQSMCRTFVRSMTAEGILKIVRSSKPTPGKGGVATEYAVLKDP